MLSRRLALLVVAAALVALGTFAFVVDATFASRQRARLGASVEREITRTAELIRSSQVGARLLEATDGIRLQFVDATGHVQVPPGGAQAFPLAVAPTISRDSDGAPIMVASRPWILPSGAEVGTLRIALDITDDVLARRTLAMTLLSTGVGLALLLSVLVWWLVRSTLAPLRRLAEQADAVDPSAVDIVVDAADARRNDEVGRLASAFARAGKAIRERQRAERDALAEIAHELAAPLTVVAGRLRAIEAHDAREEITSAREAADELVSTSQDLMVLARGELERQMELTAVSLADVARSVAAESAGVTVHTFGPCEVLGGRERLRQLVRNLVRNAVQVGSAPDDVAVTVGDSGPTVVVTVEDRGPGWPDGDPRASFKRHVSRRSGGTGLGLAVVVAIADAHDATVDARPREGGGAVVEVTFPSLASTWTTDDEVGDDGIVPEGTAPSVVP